MIMDDRRWDVRYISPHGRQWKLTSPDWVASIRSSGFVGLVGSMQALTANTPSTHGQMIGGYTIPPVEGSLSLRVRAADGRTAMENLVSLRRDFSSCEPLGTLSIASDQGTAAAHVRLRGAMSSPEYDSKLSDMLLVEVPLIIDSGVWQLETVRGTGSVTVTNSGDTTIWPELTWEGRDQSVLMPSGARVALPRVDGARVTASMDPSKAFAIRFSDDRTSRSFREEVQRLPLGEGVPPKQTRTYQLTPGVSMSYAVEVLDPWL